jgi:hypothetical protein
LLLSFATGKKKGELPVRRFVGAFLGCAMAFASSAVADVQKCTMNVGRITQGDMISKEIYLTYDEGTKTLQVLDNIVAYFNKQKPMVAKISADKDASRTFDWAVLMVNDAGQRTKMQYHATLFHAKKEIHVMARPVGYRNTISATGKCAPYQG